MKIRLFEHLHSLSHDFHVDKNAPESIGLAAYACDTVPRMVDLMIFQIFTAALDLITVFGVQVDFNGRILHAFTNSSIFLLALLQLPWLLCISSSLSECLNGISIALEIYKGKVFENLPS